MSTTTTRSRTQSAKKKQGRAANRKNGATKKRSARRRAAKKPAFTAKNSDKQILYQLSVQDAKVEVEFIADAYKKLNKKVALSLREDFCGTQLICAEWVKSNDKRRATGVDIDPKVLAWGKQHNVEPLGDSAKRITQLAQDVRAPSKSKFDAICAFNFSYWIFKTRDEMRGYFEKVKKGLAPGGIFCLDAYGGWEAVEPMYERRNIKGKFTYVWDQDVFDPITHRVVNHIHFEFKDGSKMNKAFTYDWRFWSLPELTELLTAVGFSNVVTYWDRSDDDDEEDYRPTKRADNQPGWLAYLVASR